VNFKLLNGTPDDELLQYFLLRKNVFIVMGAYGRSLLSSFFKRSSADLVLRVMDLPVFIAHHK
jgi:nucleotide-binding universal stress UspA family protein